MNGINASSFHIPTASLYVAGTVLASGGRDTDVILWDLITESGLYRLRGHKVRLLFLSICMIGLGALCAHYAFTSNPGLNFHLHH